MNDDLDDLLRDHYRAAADDVHADPATVRRFQDAARSTRTVPVPLRTWMLPTLAAALTAAVLVAVVLLLWPVTRNPEQPRPMGPAQEMDPPVPTPTNQPSAPPTPAPSASPPTTASPSVTVSPTGTVSPTTTDAPATRQPDGTRP
ncbi:hypothetical protein [Actinomadura monticuli]|uniref:DUF3040 domain-containing protein n=1 Tax=Actinomadura monticuli TaxID=3097367 RepID=A0ABV4QBV6_9ACTN